MAPADRRIQTALRLLSLFGFVALWWLVAWRVADPRLLPAPDAVLRVAWREATEGTLVADFAATLFRVAAAFSISMVIGTALGFAAGRSSWADAVIDPLLTLALNLPLLVVIVLVYVWVGLNETAAILAVAIAKIPTVAVTIREGARAFDPGFSEVGAVFAVPAGTQLRRILLPQLVPYIAAAGRAGLSITWKIVLVVELLGRPDGVGYALNRAFNNFDVAAILAYGLLFAALMLAIEVGVFQPWERRTRAWRTGGQRTARPRLAGPGIA
jgi:NitT/TauT family transport system permease protein